MAQTDTVYNKNSIVKFSRAMYNEGCHFNPGDSIFIASKSGLYLFSWEVQCHKGKARYTELKVDNITTQRQFSQLGGTGDFFATTRNICRISKGSHVWIETGNIFSENFFGYEKGTKTTSSFMGALLYKE